MRRMSGSFASSRNPSGWRRSVRRRRRWPTTYYGYDSGVGLVLRQHRVDTPRRVRVIGLGAGTLAVYAQPGDKWRLYEINPDVVKLADEYFTYLYQTIDN